MENINQPPALTEPEITEVQTPVDEPSAEALAEINNPAEDARPDIDALIAEAEQRGYLRGLNKRAEELFNRPALGDTPPAADSAGNEMPGSGDVMILNRSHVSIWD